LAAAVADVFLVTEEEPLFAAEVEDDDFVLAGAFAVFGAAFFVTVCK
jgi:hypothetical protein